MPLATTWLLHRVRHVGSDGASLALGADVTDQPWQFRPETYGAKGDGKIGTGGTGSAGSPTFTDAGANFGSGDVGKYIVINQGTSGSGTAGGTAQNPFCGTIASVQSATSVTLSGNLAAATAAAPYIYGTDDAPAINSALAAASTYAQANRYFAQILFSASYYMLGTLTQATTPNRFNTHLKIPVGAQASRKTVIELIGAGDASEPQYWEPTVPSIQGSCLVSAVFGTGQPDGTFGQMSVIGGPTSTAGLSPGNFANTLLSLDGITVVCPWNSQQWGVMGDYLAQVDVGRASYQAFAPVNLAGAIIGGPYLNQGNIVPNGVSVGFSFPVFGNNAQNNVDWLTAEGVSIGVQFAEHFAAIRLLSLYTNTGVLITGVSSIKHGGSILHYLCEGSNYCLTTSAGTPNAIYPIFIGLMDSETISTAHINDPNNNLGGTIYWASGSSTRPVVTGGQQLQVIDTTQHVPGPWAAAPAAPTSGAAQQNLAYRHAVVYASASTSITNTGSGPASTGLTALGQTAGAGVVVPIRVPPGHYYSVTYTGTLTTVWELD